MIIPSILILTHCKLPLPSKFSDFDKQFVLFCAIGALSISIFNLFVTALKGHPAIFIFNFIEFAGNVEVVSKNVNSESLRNCINFEGQIL